MASMRQRRLTSKKLMEFFQKEGKYLTAKEYANLKVQPVRAARVRAILGPWSKAVNRSRQYCPEIAAELDAKMEGEVANLEGNLKVLEALAAASKGGSEETEQAANEEPAAEEVETSEQVDTDGQEPKE